MYVMTDLELADDASAVVVLVVISQTTAVERKRLEVILEVVEVSHLLQLLVVHLSTTPSNLKASRVLVGSATARTMTFSFTSK